METIVSKKEIFKLLIKEFHESDLPLVIKRDLEVPLNHRKIVSVFGPRRSGKSFFFFYLIQNLTENNVEKDRIVYLNFEDDRILPLNFKDFNFLIEAYYELYPHNKSNKVILFLDEIQNIPKWEVFVRRIYDKENVQIFLTGSSSKLLAKEISTALRGRTLSYALYPLSFREFLRFKGLEIGENFQFSKKRFFIKKYLDEYLEFGGFPEVVLEKNLSIKRKILKEYFDMLVYYDLMERYKITNSNLLKDLLVYLSTNITSLFSVNSYFRYIKKELPVSRNTILEYLSHIQDTEYFYLLPKFSYSLKEQRVNPKKIICLDDGLRNKISFRFSPDYGKLAENLVGSTLLRTDKQVFYWQGRQEVDFVVKEGKYLEVINVSYGEILEDRELESLFEFAQKFKNVKNITLITKDIKKKYKNINFVPLYEWLLVNNYY